MNWERFQAALIRMFYTAVLPLIGALVAWLIGDGNLESIGVESEYLALAIGAVLYGVKKLLLPDTKF